MQRVTTKMILPEAQLALALEQVTEDYEVLEIGDRRLHHYWTQYFDTPSYALYHQHHNEQRDRYKVRTRRYSDLGLAFFEVKRKTSREITIKERLQIAQASEDIGAEGRAFLALHCPCPAQELAPVLWTVFWRATLASRDRSERLTMDTGISLHTRRAEIALPGLAVVEIKRAGHALRSPLGRQLRELGVRPTGFSKYCMGISMLLPHLKHNRFKPQHRLLERLSAGCASSSSCGLPFEPEQETEGHG
jgi:hypothetical protein